MGGKNPFLGIAYIVVGGICVVLGALFTATHLIRPRFVSLPTMDPSVADTRGAGNWEITRICPGATTRRRLPRHQVEKQGLETLRRPDLYVYMF